MVSGLLPPHFLSSDPVQDLRAYVADYLKEEIATEAVMAWGMAWGRTTVTNYNNSERILK
ncbi:MAG: hypothetical protein PF495_16050 [Spirochaetales bacterium]|jgi:dienelactone hydrolase|nr:hypothetical protein [Spirochaetales bacterium]